MSTEMHHPLAAQHMNAMRFRTFHHCSSAAASTLPSTPRPCPPLRPRLRRSRPRRYTNATSIRADAHTKPLVVVGSVNADMMLQVDRFPKPGETLSAKSMTTSAGGKVLQVQLFCSSNSMCMTCARNSRKTQWHICREPTKLQLQQA